MKTNNEIFLERILCDCGAQRHKLINNCLSCGKVVCSREGEGPCLSCGQIVTIPDSNYIPANEELFPSLSKEEQIKASQERSLAINHVHTLIERDHRPQLIIDEQVDFHDITDNKWIGDEARKEAVQRILNKNRIIQEHELRNDVVFDFETNSYVKQEFIFDEESFKQEGREYLQSKENEIVENNMEKGKKEWRSKNDKLQEIRDEILPKKINATKIIKNKAVEMLIEKEEEL